MGCLSGRCGKESGGLTMMFKCELLNSMRYVSDPDTALDNGQCLMW